MSSPETPTVALAQEALAEGQLEEAIRIARQVIEADPVSYDGWQVAGVAYSQSGRQPEAIEAFKNCVRQRPNIPQPHYNLAQAYLACGEREKARSELELCLSVDPSYQLAGQMVKQLGPAPEERLFGPPGVYMQPPGPSGPFSPSLYPAGPPVPATPSIGGAEVPDAPQAYGGLAGGTTPTQTAGYISPFSPMAPPPPPLSTLPGSTIAWAILTMVLALLSALFWLLPTIAGSLVALLMELLSIGYIAGSVGTLARQNWGRAALSVCAILGTGVGFACLLIGIFGNRFLEPFEKLLTPDVRQLIQQLLAKPGATTMAIEIVFGILAVIYFSYNLPLFMNVSSLRVKETMRR